MTQQQHPITPPPELVREWREEPAFSALSPCSVVSLTTTKLQDIATRAAQWGADQELEACCAWLEYELVEEGHDFRETLITALRAARRPKPPSLNEQALEAWERQMNCYEETDPDMNTIRRALERLQELEGGND